MQESRQAVLVGLLLLAVSVAAYSSSVTIHSPTGASPSRVSNGDELYYDVSWDVTDHPGFDPGNGVVFEICFMITSSHTACNWIIGATGGLDGSRSHYTGSKTVTLQDGTYDVRVQIYSCKPGCTTNGLLCRDQVLASRTEIGALIVGQGSDSFSVHYVSPSEGSTIRTSDMMGEACCYPFDIDIDYNVTGNGSFCFNFAPQGESCTGCDSGPGYDVTAGSGLLSLSSQLWCCHVQKLCGYTGPAVLSIWFLNDDTGIMSDPIHVNYTIAPPQNDTTPPQPDPSSWELPPDALGSSEITMAALHTEDASGVEFYFECTSGGGHDSGWQDSDNYTDTGLSPNAQYCYRVRARDKSANQNGTGWSPIACATTLVQAGDTSPPTPDPPVWLVTPAAVGSHSIAMSVQPCSDPSGVEYYFEETSGNPGGSDSGWQDSPEFADTGLSPNTYYYYKARARDKSAGSNATSWTDLRAALTMAEADLAVTNLEFHTHDKDNSRSLSSSDWMVISARVFNNSPAYVATGVTVRFEDTSGGWEEETAPQDVGPKSCAYFQIVRSFASGYSSDIAAVVVSSESIDPWAANDALTRPLAIWYAAGTDSRSGFSLVHDAYSFANWPDFTVPVAKWDVGGHCFGMSLMALRYWDETEPLPDSALTTYELERTGKARESIEYAQKVEQQGVNIAYMLDLCSGIFEQKHEFDSFVGEIKAGRPAIASLKPGNGIGGHAVLGYRLVEVQDETRVYVYDNNNEYNGDDQFSGSYFLSFNPEGTAFSGVWNHLVTEDCELRDFEYYPEFTKARCVTLPFPEVDVLAGLKSLAMCYARNDPLVSPVYYQFLGSPAHALFIDEQGRRFGVEGSTFHNEIPGARVSLVGGIDVYVLPGGGPYEVLISCFDDGPVHLVSLSQGTAGDAMTAFAEVLAEAGMRIAFGYEAGGLEVPAEVDLDGDGRTDELLMPDTVVMLTGPWMLGDVNSDGSIDVLDVRLSYQIASGEIGPAAAQQTAADVDGDGDVDMYDVVVLAQYVISMRETLP